MTVPTPQETKRTEPLPLTREEFQKQLDSAHSQVYDSLRTHFEQARKREETSTRGVVPWLGRHRADLYFLVVLLVLGGAWFKSRNGTKVSTPDPIDTARVVVTNPPQPLRSRPLLSIAIALPDSALGHYLVTNPSRATTWLNAVAAAGAELDRTVRDKVANKKRLTEPELTSVRDPIFRDILRRWKADWKKKNPNTGADTADETLLNELMMRLDLGDVVGGADTGSVGFRSAVIVRWMQSFSTEDTTF
jgi:hypothetical protein